MVNSQIVTNFINALNNKFENKVSNKKTNIDGDYTSDTSSYPTVQAVKDWVTSQMSSIGNLMLGETSNTAYRGDRGKTAYDHSQTTSGNPHNVTKTDIGLGNVTNTEQAPITHVGDSTHLTTSDKTAIAKIGTIEGDLSDLEEGLSSVATSGSYTDLSDKPSIPSNTSDLINDSDYITSEHISKKEDTINKATSWGRTPTDAQYPSLKLVYDSLETKVDKITGKGLSSNDFTNTYKNTLDNLNTTLDGYEVTVEKSATAETGYIATYKVMQGNTQVGASINIPKDYLVKSATMETCTTINNPVTGYMVGDKYLDFVINTKDNTGTSEHLYILVSDLVDTYTAGAGLTLTSNEFSIGTGAIGLSMLATGVQTSLGYADNWNSSTAKTITSTDVTNWNNKSTLTVSDVDSEIESYLTAITNAL